MICFCTKTMIHGVVDGNPLIAPELHLANISHQESGDLKALRTSAPASPKERTWSGALFISCKCFGSVGKTRYRGMLAILKNFPSLLYFLYPSLMRASASLVCRRAAFQGPKIPGGTPTDSTSTYVNRIVSTWQSFCWCCRGTYVDRVVIIHPICNQTNKNHSRKSSFVNGRKFFNQFPQRHLSRIIYLCMWVAKQQKKKVPTSDRYYPLHISRTSHSYIPAALGISSLGNRSEPVRKPNPSISRRYLSVYSRDRQYLLGTNMNSKVKEGMQRTMPFSIDLAGIMDKSVT